MVDAVVWWFLFLLSPILLLFTNLILTMPVLCTALWNSWTSLWFYITMLDYYFLISINHLANVSFGFLRDVLVSIVWFIDKNVSVQFFIYYMFLTIATILSILINHAGQYTLPYPKCGQARRSRSSCRGLYLARYHASLRNKSTIIFPQTTTTFNRGRHGSHFSFKTFKSTAPTPDPISTSSSD
jgi:hypothetical protein